MNEQDLFSFGRFVNDSSFDPETYQPYWIVSTPRITDKKFTNQHDAYNEYFSRVEQYSDTKIIAPSFPLLIS